MNTRTSKLLAGIILFGGAACAPRVQAQSSFALPFSLTQSSPATGFSIDANGTFIEKGPLSSSVTLTLSGSPQMVWFPAFAAFRAGSFTNTQATIGQYSAAFGSANTASGQYSSVFGNNSTASGQGAFAAGANNVSSGNGSVALGNISSATGTGAVALGGGTSSSTISVAMGTSTASSFASVAMGGWTLASGYYSTSLGYYSQAIGYGSLAAGQYTTAGSWSAVALGQYNTGLSASGAAPSATTWVATDPLLEVGNGTSSSAKSDALVLYKNGSAKFQGVVTVAPSSDIPMYTGNPQP